jgi:hypothetical protein
MVKELLPTDERIRQQLGRSLAQIFLAMRQDIRTETAIKADWAKQHFQIYDWGAIAQSDKPVPDKTASEKWPFLF